MNIRKVLISLLAILFFIYSIPPFELHTIAQEQVLKENIKIPSPLATINGEEWYGSDWSADLGTVDIDELHLPEKAENIVVEIHSMDDTYVKKLTEHTGTVYKIGAVKSTGVTATLTAEVDSNDGYFEWFYIPPYRNYLAYDLDGVRHVRKYSQNVTYPIANATYASMKKEEDLPSSFSANGSAPSWYTASSANYLKVFADEKPGQANIGWAERNLNLEWAKFDNDTLGIKNIPLSSLKNVHLDTNDIIYKEPNAQLGALSASQIKQKLVMDDSATILANKKAKIWFSATMGSNFEPQPTSNGFDNIRYCNRWNATLTSTIYKFPKYKIVVKYEGKTDETMSLEGGDTGNVCLNEPTQFKAILTIPGVGMDNANKYAIWKSSDESIATVEKGLVTSKKSGKVTISATYVSPSSKLETTAEKTIEVVQCGDAALTVNSDDMPSCVGIGDTFQIKTRITKKDGFVWDFSTTEPHPKLTYKSSDTSIATVTSTGLVKFLKVGVVTITSTYTEGDGSKPLVVESKFNVATTKNSCGNVPDTPTTPTNPGGGGGACPKATISDGVGQSMQAQFLDAAPFATVFFINEATICFFIDLKHFITF